MNAPETDMTFTLREDQLDALKEVVNIGVGRAASLLFDVLNAAVKLRVPFIKLFFLKDLDSALEDYRLLPLSAVQMAFSGAFTGTASLVFPPDSAGKLVSLLAGEDAEDPDLNSIRIGALSEIGNIVINGVMGSIGNILNQHISYSIPVYLEGSLGQLLAPKSPDASSTVMLARTNFTVEEHLIEGTIFLLFELGSFDVLVEAIDGLILRSQPQGSQ